MSSSWYKYQKGDFMHYTRGTYRKNPFNFGPELDPSFLLELDDIVALQEQLALRDGGGNIVYELSTKSEVSPIVDLDKADKLSVVRGWVNQSSAEEWVELNKDKEWVKIELYFPNSQQD
jgi:hypothetical protein